MLKDVCDTYKLNKKENKMAEQEPITFSITEDDVTKDYNLDDLPEEGQLVYRKPQLYKNKKINL